MRRVARSSVGLLGVLATSLLHALLFAVALRESADAVAPRLPDSTGTGANAGRAEGVSEERMIIVLLQTGAVDTQPTQIDVPVLLEPVKVASMVEVTGPDALPMKPLEWSEAEDATESSEADLLARTKLAGLYEGQIRARIERAWTRPGNDPQDSEFSCRVRISQDHAGYVKEVQLQRCNGSWNWQKSLSDAVFAASPLPAPPNPAAFVDAFSMQFIALARDATGGMSN